MRLFKQPSIRRPFIGLLISILALGCYWQEAFQSAGQSQSESDLERQWENAYRVRNGVIRKETLYNTQHLFEHYQSRTTLFAESMAPLSVRWSLLWRWMGDAAWFHRNADRDSLRTRYLTDRFQETVINEQALYLDLAQIVQEFATAMELNAAAYFSGAMQSEAMSEFREQWRDQLQEEIRELAGQLNQIVVEGKAFNRKVTGLMAADLLLETSIYAALAISMFVPLKVAVPILLTAGAVWFVKQQMSPEISAYHRAAEGEALRAVMELQEKVMHGDEKTPGLMVILKRAQIQFEEAVLAHGY